MGHYRHPLQRPDLRMAFKTKLNGPKMVAPAVATTGTRYLRNGRKHCATATFLQKLIQNGAEMDPENGAEIDPKWSRNGPRNGPKMVATANASAATRGSQKRVKTLG